MTNPYNLEESFFTTKDKSLSSTAMLISNENAKILDKFAPKINAFFQQQQLTNNLKISGTVTCDNIIAKNLQTVDQETGNITSNITVNSVQNTMNIFEANTAFIDFLRSNNITVTSTISSNALNANVINVTTTITSNEINVTGDLEVNGVINGDVNGNVHGNAATASAAQPNSDLEQQIDDKLNKTDTQFNGNAATASAAASGSTLEQQINDLIQRVEDLENGS